VCEYVGDKPICAAKATETTVQTSSFSMTSGSQLEHTGWDPKDGELCLGRMKPEETLVEVRRGSDVQIDRQTWV